jgi:hypothetical protein
LKGNYAGDEAAKVFAEAMMRDGHVRLESLDLSYNRINDAGGEILAEALATN